MNLFRITFYSFLLSFLWTCPSVAADDISLGKKLVLVEPKKSEELSELSDGVKTLFCGVDPNLLKAEDKLWLAMTRVVQSYANIALREDAIALAEELQKDAFAEQKSKKKHRKVFRKCGFCLGRLTEKNGNLIGLAGGAAWTLGDGFCRVDEACKLFTQSKEYQMLRREHGDYVPSVPVLRKVLKIVSGAVASYGVWKRKGSDSPIEQVLFGEMFDFRQHIWDGPAHVVESVFLQQLIPALIYVKNPCGAKGVRGSFNSQRAWRSAVLWSARKAFYEGNIELATRLINGVGKEKLKKLRNYSFGLLDFDLPALVGDLALLGGVQKLRVPSTGQSGSLRKKIRKNFACFKKEDLERLKKAGVAGASRACDDESLGEIYGSAFKTYAAEKVTAFAIEKGLNRFEQPLCRRVDRAFVLGGKLLLGVGLLSNERLDKWKASLGGAKMLAQLLIAKVVAMGRTGSQKFEGRRSLAFSLATGRMLGDPLFAVTGFDKESSQRILAGVLATSLLQGAKRVGPTNFSFYRPLGEESAIGWHAIKAGFAGTLWYLMASSDMPDMKDLLPPMVDPGAMQKERLSLEVIPCVSKSYKQVSK